MAKGWWWRAYDTAVSDPKLGMLTDEEHRAWFNMLCLASANGGTLPTVEVIAYQLRMTVHKASDMIHALSEAGLMDWNSDATYRPHNWDKRQYKSDASDPNAADRMQRYRQRKRNARNATVTTIPPETETETETEKNKKAAVRANRASRACRLPTDAVPSTDNIADAKLTGMTQAEIDQQWQRMKDWSHSSPKGACLDWNARWRNWCGTFITGRGHSNGAAFPESGHQRDKRKSREVLDALRRSIEDETSEGGSDPDTRLLQQHRDKQ